MSMRGRGRYQINLTLLLELGVVREDVQRKRVVPSVDEFDGLVEIVDGNDGQDRCKYFPGRGAVVRKRNSWRPPDLVHSLAHQGIIRADALDDRRSNVFRLMVGFSTKDDGSFGVVQHFLDPIEATMVWETSDDPRFSRAIRIKFPISRQSSQGQRYRGRNGREFAYASSRAVTNASSPCFGMRI